MTANEKQPKLERWTVRKSNKDPLFKIMGPLGGKYKVAIVPYHRGDKEDENDFFYREASIHAALIARAPELLESLEHCLQILEEVATPDYLQETVGKMLMNYRTLINKATTL